MSLQNETDTHSADTVCFVCLMRPYILMSICTGIIGISCSCPHFNKSVRFVSFHHSSIALLTALVFAAVNLIFTSYNAWHIIRHESEWYKLPFLSYQMHACLLQVSRLRLLDGIIKEYTGLAALIENCQLYGVEQVYNKKGVKDFKLHTTIVLTVLISLLVSYTIYRFIINDFNLWDVLITFIETMQIAEQIILAASYVANFRVYIQLMQVCYTHIKQCLNCRIANVEEYDTGGCVNIIEEHSIFLKGIQNKITLKEATITKLQKLQRMHIAIMTNFEQTIDMISLIILLVTSSYSMVLTISLYNLFTQWWNGIMITYSVMFRFVEVLFILLYVPWVLFTVKRVNYVANDILDFLQNFPINRLNTNESSQVESIIITIRSMRPNITAGGLFEMDIGVYCSLLVVVISYFLLAIQFQASWLDK